MNSKPLKKYLILTFFITWVCWWGDALLVKITVLKESDAIPMFLFTLGGFGPTFAACFCLEGKFTWRKLGEFLTGYKKRGIWYLLLFVVIEILTFGLASRGILAPLQQAAVPAVVIIFIVFLQAAIMYGGNEEWGWRGIMQPVLQETIPYILATLIVGIVWVGWHIPLWFIEGNSHQSMSFLSFAVLGILLSYWLSAIYNVTGSIIFCMIMHGLTNTLMGVFEIEVNAVYIAGLVILTVLSILISVKRLNQTIT